MTPANPELVIYTGVGVLFLIAFVFVYVVPRYALNA